MEAATGQPEFYDIEFLVGIPGKELVIPEALAPRRRVLRTVT